MEVIWQSDHEGGCSKNGRFGETVDCHKMSCCGKINGGVILVIGVKGLVDGKF